MRPFSDRRLEAELPPGKLVPETADSVFSDLAAYLKKPIEQIASDYWEGRQSEQGQAQEAVAAAAEERPVLDFYRSTPHYLYELSYWEGCQDKQRWFHVLAQACRKYRLKRVLDYGGGVGGLSLFLHQRGICCDYLDVAGKTFDYAAWRFKRAGTPAKMFNILRGWPGQRYDAIVAWDVLEHLFDLEGTVDQVGAHLNTGGWFLHKSTFAHGQEHDAHIHLAKHAIYQDIERFNTMLCSRGFHYRGQLKPSRLARLSSRMRLGGGGIRISTRLKHGGNFLVHERR
jgi:2-polyprenyl-3-methyl-5-hydroxy-6-metoxy-1,4-benzoquinol methylase